MEQQGDDLYGRESPLVVIICPARELAVQIFNVARKFCYKTMLRPDVIYGGVPLKDQIYQLQRGCDILIASPGRLVDMMDRPSVLSLRREEEFNKILSGGEQEEGNVKYMAKDHLAASHLRINVGRLDSSHANIEQQSARHPQSPTREREDAMRAFRNGKTPILVATGVKSHRPSRSEGQGFPFLLLGHFSQSLVEQVVVCCYSGPEPTAGADAGDWGAGSGDAGSGETETKPAPLPLPFEHHDAPPPPPFEHRDAPPLPFEHRDAPPPLTPTQRHLFERVYSWEKTTVDHGGITEYTHRIGRIYGQYECMPMGASDEEIEGEDAGGWGTGNGDVGGWGAVDGVPWMLRVKMLEVGAPAMVMLAVGVPTTPPTEATPVG
ncbi:hypothetical protein G7054_g7824 [Neopestalotiopsis clavispora]|nr:hypothetical protein G7054_g7824 [Neopestalotiopsis clavispora]